MSLEDSRARERLAPFCSSAGPSLAPRPPSPSCQGLAPAPTSGKSFPKGPGSPAPAAASCPGWSAGSGAGEWSGSSVLAEAQEAEEEINGLLCAHRASQAGLLLGLALM